MLLDSRRVGVLVLSVVLSAAVIGAAAAPGRSFPDPDTGLRQDTPNDPDFDCSEPDDEDAATAEPCAYVFDEQYNLFGFAPAATRLTATYKDGERLGQGQISGVAGDAAWKLSIGSPQVAIAVTDTGIRWDNSNLRTKIWLNAGELPRPRKADGQAGDYDLDGDGAFTVDDYAQDARVTDRNENGVLDAQDLIRSFSDGTDGDTNGYIDDIAGWDVFDNDNDPEDLSSYSSAGNHGTGRSREAAQQTDDGDGEAGVCPRCRIMPVRVWDTFVAPGDNYAAATVYAADAGARVQVAALGVLQNTRAAKAAVRYAYDKGMALMHVSSDLNTASHNYPTNYVESVFINGCVADTHGLGTEIPGLSDLLNALGILDTQIPVLSWFRNSNLTQYGAHAHVCYMGTTGSEATGQAGGGAGLIHSYGIERASEIGGPLTSNEVKQILTLSAEDVLPENTAGLGLADAAQIGWDEHFGYGRADLGGALRMIQDGRIPPEALIETPAWWALLDPAATQPVAIKGLARAQRSGGCSYELRWAAGLEPTAAAFSEPFALGDCPDQPGEILGELPLAQIAASLPGAAEGTPPANPNSYVFTVRLDVTDADGNRGEDRKTYHLFHDPSAHAGWPLFVDTGGESSPVLYDLDGDGLLEVLDANSAGELCVRRHDGSSLPAFNGGACWQLPPTAHYHPQSAAHASGKVPPPTGGFRTPAVADVDGDFLPEIVLLAGDGRGYVLSAAGAVKHEFGVDPLLSVPALRSRSNHVKRGFLAAPVIADLDGDGAREIIAAALDGHVYVWAGASGARRDGFPVRLADPAVAEFYGGELIGTPAVGDLDGDGQLEIVAGSSELYDAGGLAPEPSLDGVVNAVQGLVTNLLANALGGSSRVYALRSDGSFVDGWPVTLSGVLPDILPFIGPNHTAAIADLDGDGDDEVVASITTGDVHVIDGDGTVLKVLQNIVGAGLLRDTLLETLQDVVAVGGATDLVKIFNLFEYPVIGNFDGQEGPEIAKGGLGLNAVLNLLLVGQNLPFNHVVQAWSPATGTYLPGYPVATDDYQLLSTPAIADVDGGTPELIVGNGLYLIHAYTGSGGEAPGFPKLTGGWNFAVPAIGDIDGDGLLEMAASTREGYRFVWDLAAPATAAANSEWWTEGHDECHTNNYRTDCRPPATITDFRLEQGVLKFTATGDDWRVGANDRYELRTAATPILTRADWDAAAALEPPAGSQPAGTVVSLAVPADARRFVALLAYDDAGNTGLLATVDRGETVTPPDPDPGTDPVPSPSPPTPAPTATPTSAPTPRPSAGDGGGAFGWLTLLPLLGAARRRAKGLQPAPGACV
jgi:hypothetical protein